MKIQLIIQQDNNEHYNATFYLFLTIPDPYIYYQLNLFKTF